jgi:hypothetical protein
MINVEVARASANVEALDQVLRREFGHLCSGLSLGPGVITIHLDDRATAVQIERARFMVQEHNPAVLTPEQEEKLIKRQRLDQARWNLGEIDLDKLTPLERWLLLEVTRLSEQVPD